MLTSIRILRVRGLPATSRAFTKLFKWGQHAFVVRLVSAAVSRLYTFRIFKAERPYTI